MGPDLFPDVFQLSFFAGDAHALFGHVVAFAKKEEQLVAVFQDDLGRGFFLYVRAKFAPSFIDSFLKGSEGAPMGPLIRTCLLRFLAQSGFSFHCLAGGFSRLRFSSSAFSHGISLRSVIAII